MENTNEKKFIVVNGYERKNCKNKNEVRDYIKETLDQHNLAPVLIANNSSLEHIKDYDGTTRYVKITNLVYLYCTIYQESFTIYETDANDQFPDKRLYDEIKWKLQTKVEEY